MSDEKKMSEIPPETDDKAIRQTKTQKLYVWLLSIAGYLLSALAIPLLIRSLFATPETQPLEIGIIVLLLSVNLIIWIPVTFVALRIRKRTGFTTAVIFLAAAMIASSLLMRGCFAI